MTDRGRNRSNAVARVVGTARAILTYQVGLPMGALRMDRALAWLNDEEAAEYSIFSEYMKSVTGLPIGTERLEWSAEVLKEKDKLLETINAQFRDRIFDAARELLQRFSEEADAVRKRDRDRK